MISRFGKIEIRVLRNNLSVLAWWLDDVDRRRSFSPFGSFAWVFVEQPQQEDVECVRCE
jgi:hypothetical protein